MRGASLTCCVGAALLFFALLFSGPAESQELTFVPQITSSEGYFGIDASSMEGSYVHNGIETKSTAKVLGEHIEVSAEGYVYHPRFMSFLARLAEGLNQQKVDGAPTHTESSPNYEIRTWFLPEHPYSLELFKVHSQAYNPGAPVIADLSGSLDQEGALFIYKMKPFLFRAGYTDDQVNSSANSAESQTYRVNAEYVGRQMTNAGAYVHSDTSTARGSQATRDDYTLSDSIHLDMFRLDSSINQLNQDQTELRAPGYQSETFAWNEHLSVSLPWNFTAKASSYYRTEDLRREVLGSPPDEESNRTTSMSAGVYHHLYQSLSTDLFFNKSQTASPRGDYKTNGVTFSTNYLKTLPMGRLNLGLQLGNSETEQDGAPVIINETHNGVQLGTPFSLTQINIQLSSISVQVRDTVSATWIQLPQSGFLISRLGSAVQVTVVSVSPMTPLPPGSPYDFIVSYSLIPQQSVLDSNFTAYIFRTDMFDGLLNVYYNYAVSHQTLVSGTVPGGPDRTIQQTFGVIVNFDSYSGLLEYVDYASRLSPYVSKKCQFDYRKPVTDDTSVTAIITYTKTDYPFVASVNTLPNYEVTLTQTSLNLSSKFPREHLVFRMSGSYNMTRSAWTSNYFMGTTTLTWTAGLVAVTAGAELSRMESSSLGNSSTTQSQYYYLNMNRKLF